MPQETLDTQYAQARRAQIRHNVAASEKAITAPKVSSSDYGALLPHHGPVDRNRIAVTGGRAPKSELESVNMPTSEQEKADVSKSRGVTAAHIPDSAAKREYIAKQGQAESKGMDKTPELKQEDFNKRNQLVVEGNMKKGGIVPKTGLYKMHKNEVVLPVPTVLTGEAPKRAPGAKKTKVVNVKKGKKLSTGDKKKVSSAFDEIKKNPPKVLAKTAKKSGAAQAEKQRVAIGLSKARAAGANIPEKK
jgi:hypothetical protein